MQRIPSNAFILNDRKVQMSWGRWNENTCTFAGHASSSMCRCSFEALVAFINLESLSKLFYTRMCTTRYNNTVPFGAIEEAVAKIILHTEVALMEERSNYRTFISSNAKQPTFVCKSHQCILCKAVVCLPLRSSVPRFKHDRHDSLDGAFFPLVSLFRCPRMHVAIFLFKRKVRKTESEWPMTKFIVADADGTWRKWEKNEAVRLKF